jgi:hypothetical protein
MGDQKTICLKPPFYVLAQGRTLDAHDWTTLNHSTTFWFTSSEAAKAYCIRNSNLPNATRPHLLANWREVAIAMANLCHLKLHYALLDPIDTKDRRIWIADIFRQLQKIGPQLMSAAEVKDNLVDSIDVYCDESGTPPVADKEGAFVVSALAVPGGTVSELPYEKYGPKKTVMNLAGVKAVHASYKIKPYVGYAAALAKKIEQYKFVSEINGEVGRPQIWFTSGDQIRTSHFVWVFAMQSALAWILPFAAKRNGWFVGNVRFFFNEFQLTDTMRKFFMDALIPMVPRNAVEVCVAGVNRAFLTPDQKIMATRWADKYRIGSVTRQFDNDEPFLGDWGLMRLADRLAHFMYKQVGPKNGKRRLFAEMRAAGMTPEHPVDISKLVVYNHSRALDRWEAETGMKVPE